MRRRLIIIGLIAALSAGGAGGALASALCARDGADASEHACCREDAGGDSANESCPMSARKKSDSHTAHAARAESRAHAESRARAAKETRAARRATVAATRGGARLVPPPSCAHCVGDTGAPPAAFKLRGADSSRRVADETARRSTPHVRHAYDSFIPHVTPTQGAPPGDAARRHVLHGVFLI
jgi:hypothetical protein